MVVWGLYEGSLGFHESWHALEFPDRGMYSDEAPGSVARAVIPITKAQIQSLSPEFNR